MFDGAVRRVRGKVSGEEGCRGPNRRREEEKEEEEEEEVEASNTV